MNPNTNPRPIAGTITDRSGAIVAGGTSQIIAPENGARCYLVVQNVSDTTMYVNFGAAAKVDDDSIRLLAGGSVTFNGGWVPGSAVHVICSSAGKKFVAKEGLS